MNPLVGWAEGASDNQTGEPDAPPPKKTVSNDWTGGRCTEHTFILPLKDLKDL
jgi:hypothetical protein